jgi:uncharacterized protein YciI
MKGYFEDHRASFDEHLECLRQIEADGTMFAAGVLKDETGWDGSGMAIIRAASYDEAVKVGEAEPFHRAGVRKNTIQGWVMNEANFQFTLKVIGNEGDEEVGRCFNKRGRKFTPAVPAKGREMFRFKGIKTLKNLRLPMLRSRTISITTVISTRTKRSRRIDLRRWLICDAG